MIKVFFDGKCNLCNREIKYYKSISPKGKFNWIDITRNKNLLKKENIEYVDGLKVLHAKNKNGKLFKGLDAFILIWKNLKIWKYIAIIASLPIIYHILKLIYILFANWRFNRLSHCVIELNNKKK